MAEVKKIIYSGDDTDDVTAKMEEGEAKMVAKGWEPRRVDMLSSSTLRVTYVRGPEDEDEETMEEEEF